MLEYFLGDTLDGFYFTTCNDTAFVNDGIEIKDVYTILSPESLKSQLTMNPSGDTISLWNTSGYQWWEIIFGRCSGNTIASPSAGHSISLSESGHYYFDSTPTLGAANDSSGAMGVIHGMITDTSSHPLSDVEIRSWLWYNRYPTDNDGYFSIEMLAMQGWFIAEKEGYQEFFSPSFQVYPDCAVVLDTIQLIGPTVKITSETRTVPQQFSLSNNYPNPFNPSTIFTYEIPTDDYVDVAIYDMKGHHLTTLFSGKQSAGKYTVQWDASTYPSGIYIYELRTSEYGESRKCTLVK